MSKKEEFWEGDVWMSYFIGSFNIRDFNWRYTSGNEKDLDKIAKIIIQEKFDVVAIQEINSETAIKELTHTLNRNRRFDREYEYSYGKNMPTLSKDPERYGFIWNRKRLRLIEVMRGENPTYYVSAGGSTFIRPPYYARFTARGMLGGSNFELRLVNIHIKDADTEGEKLREINNLIKQILPRICDHQQLSGKMEHMPVYTFALGDYNISLNKSENALYKIDSITQTNYTGKNRYFKTVQEKKTSLKYVNSQKTLEECYANDFDHFSYEMDTIYKLKIDTERVEVLNKYIDNSSAYHLRLKEYREKVSDHVPIKLKLDLK